MMMSSSWTSDSQLIAKYLPLACAIRGSSSLSHPKVEISSRTTQPHEEPWCFGVVTSTPCPCQEVEKAEERNSTWCNWVHRCCWEWCWGQAQWSRCHWVKRGLSSTVISITCLGYQTGWGEVGKYFFEITETQTCCLPPTRSTFGLTLEWGVSWNPEISKA